MFFLIKSKKFGCWISGMIPLDIIFLGTASLKPTALRNGMV